MTIFSYEHLMSDDSENKLGLFFLEAILYPGEEKNLHVFEPRYKELVADCLAERLPFVIIRGNERHMREVGCVAYIRKILAQYEDGRVDLHVEGSYRAQVIRIDREKLYHRAVVADYEDTNEEFSIDKRLDVIAQHIELLQLAGRTIDYRDYDSDFDISWLIGRNCGLSLDQREELLEMQHEDDRLSFLSNYLDKFIPEVFEKRETMKRIMSNGHFKDFPPAHG